MNSFLTELNSENFDNFISKHEVVLVDVYAEWCGPCKMIAPILEKVSREHHDKVRIGKLNVDHNNEIASELGIRNIPTLLLYRGGERVATKIGSLSEEAIISMFSEVEN